MSTRIGDAVACCVKEEEVPMLYTLAIVLLVLWALGFLAFHVGGGLIHLLIVIAVIMLLFQLFSGRRRIV
jgi:hypothetical protein